MGTICTSGYANIFVHHFEKIYIYTFWEGISLSYLRFIDGIFFIRIGSKDQPIPFLNNLNAKHNLVKFECKVSQSSILFFLTWSFLSKRTNYAQRFVGRNKTGKFFYILIENTLYWKTA